MTDHNYGKMGYRLLKDFLLELRKVSIIRCLLMILKQLMFLILIVIKILSAAENDLPSLPVGRTIMNPSLPPCFLIIPREPFDPRTAGLTCIYSQYPSVLIGGSSYEELCNRTGPLFYDYNPYACTTLNAAYLRR